MRTAIVTGTLVLSCAATAMAQPVARHLIDDADVAEALHSELSGPSVTPFGSIHLLDDYDGDGVREALVTHADSAPGGAPGTLDYFRSVVRSLRTGEVFVVLARDETPRFKLAHASAVQIPDVDDDGVRDIAASRAFGMNMALRAYSGATGAMLWQVSPSETEFPFGLSLTPFDDTDGDGQPDLLVGHTGNNTFFDSPFRLWSPRGAVSTQFAPVNYEWQPANVACGLTVLDLGAGPDGARTLLSSRFTTVGSAGVSGSSVDFSGGTPMALRSTLAYTAFDRPLGNIHLGAAVIADVDADGLGDIVLSGRGSTPAAPDEIGLPVLSRAGAHAKADGIVELAPIAVHRPRVFADIGAGPVLVEPIADRALLGIADATGDGVDDYAFLGSIETANLGSSSPCVVAVCGRTGRAFFAAMVYVPEGSATDTHFSTPYGQGNDASKHAIVSPGDINADGSPDLIVFVVRSDLTADPAEREQLLLTHYLPTACIGDADFDRVVDLADLNAVLSNFGAQDITLPADLNADGVVNFADLNLVLSAFGASCD